MRPFHIHPRGAILSLAMGLTAFPALADSLVCQLDGKPLDFDHELTRVDVQHSSAGRPLADGKRALFRLLAAGDSGDIQIKADDVLKPGTYSLTTRAIWASTAPVDGRSRKVESGDLKIDAIRIQGNTGHVKGSTRFVVQGGASGRCEFDLPVDVMDMP